VLGHGQYGQVYLADGKLAVKQMQRRARVDVEQEAQTEVAMMKKLNHRNIAKCIALIHANDHLFYIVMEYCNGGTLEHARQKFPGGKVPAVTLRNWARQLVCGLSYLHVSARMAHRDIKPENMMLKCDVLRGCSGERIYETVKFVDFGTASEYVSGEAKIGDAKGTAAFWPPEIAEDDHEVFPVDIWALGVSLYQLAYGKFPWPMDGVNVYTIADNVTDALEAGFAFEGGPGSPAALVRRRRARFTTSLCNHRC
jgi:serine/threonine protein kinase